MLVVQMSGDLPRRILRRLRGVGYDSNSYRPFFGTCVPNRGRVTNSNRGTIRRNVIRRRGGYGRNTSEYAFQYVCLWNG